MDGDKEKVRRKRKSQWIKRKRAMTRETGGK